MTTAALTERYLAYLDCLNHRAWATLERHVHEQVQYNGESIGLAGYRRMLEADVAAIPDLVFKPELLIAQPPHIACRLLFDCTPQGELFGVPVNGRRVRFNENVFYTLHEERIAQVWSVIDKAMVAQQC